MKKKFIMLLILLTLFIPVSTKAFDLDLFQVLDGCDAVGSELNTWLKNAFKFVEFAGVGLAIVLTAVDFIQVIGGSKDDDLKNALYELPEKIEETLKNTTQIKKFAQKVYKEKDIF